MLMGRFCDFEAFKYEVHPLESKTSRSGSTALSVPEYHGGIAMDVSCDRSTKPNGYFEPSDKRASA